MAEFVEDAQPLHPDYPLPDVDDPVMRPFWDGARDGRLMQQRDRLTGAVVWPPKPLYWKGGEREGTDLHLGGGARAVPAGDAPPPAAYHGRGRPGRGGAHRRPHGRLHA